MLHPIQLAIRNDEEGAQPSPCGVVLSEIKIHKFFWLIYWSSAQECDDVLNHSIIFHQN